MSIEYGQQHKKVDRSKIPLEIKYHRQSQVLELIYTSNDEQQISKSLSAEYLRVFSPSAEVQGHTSDQAVLQFGKKLVNILGIEHQGSYAIKITFDDKHNTGIYTWNYLWELAEKHDQNWEQYLADLKAAGKSRASS